MRIIGPERTEDRELREWFAEQQRHSLDHIEDGAKTIIQLVTGLYGVLFAILALQDQPAYLQRLMVQIPGTIGVALFFLALIAALVVVLPQRVAYQEDNLSAQRRAYKGMLRRKSTALDIALALFLLGIAMLGWVIIAVLWGG